MDNFLFAQSGWVQLNSGTNVWLRSIQFTDVNTGYVCGLKGKILKTTNSGTNWFSISLDTIYEFNGIYFFNSSTGVVVGGSSNGSIYRTTNGGINWISQGYFFSSRFTCVDFADINTGFAAAIPGYIYRTTNSGINWNSVFYQSNWTMSSIKTTDINTCFGITMIPPGYNMFVKTTNSGINWLTQQINSYTILNGIYFNNALTGYVVGNILMKTTNSGNNWSTQQTSGNRLFFIDNNTGYIVHNNGIIRKTTNAGENWVNQQSGVNSNLWSVHFINSNTGFAAGENGTIIKTTTGGTSAIKQISNEIPDDFILYQNYPNPFNSSTKIKFSLPKFRNEYEQTVKLTIYDVLGCEIKVLINQELQPGLYEAEWDAINESSGSYFYMIDINGSKLCKKMVINK